MFDYCAGAELCSGRIGRKHPNKIGYQRFPRSAEAIQFAIETLPAKSLNGVLPEVNEERFGSSEIQRLYHDARYPLQRYSSRWAHRSSLVARPAAFSIALLSAQRINAIAARE